MLLNESQTSYEKLLRKIQFEGDGEFHKISLFYDFYGNKDEEIAEKLSRCNTSTLLTVNQMLDLLLKQQEMNELEKNL